MATTYERREYDFYRNADFRLRWPAIIAGFFAAVAVQLVLLAIGGAVGISGLTAVYHPGAVEGWNIAAGIWTILSPIASLFVGGLLAVFLARPVDRRMATFHGGMVWALSMILGGAIVLAVAAPGIAGTLGGATAGAGATVAADHSRTAPKSSATATRSDLNQRLDRNGNGTSRDEALGTAKTAAKAGTGLAWGTVVAMLLGFCGAIGGSLAGFNAISVRPDRGARAGTVEEERHIEPPLATDYDRPELH